MDRIDPFPTLVRGGLFVYVLIALFPIYWTINTALKPLKYINTFPPTFYPRGLTLESFQWVLTNPRSTNAFIDSLIVATGTTVIAVLLGAMAGYGFSRYPNRVGGDDVAFWLLSTRAFPPIAVVLPIFFIWGWLGLQDTHLGLILLYLTFNVPFTTWLMRDFFNKIPVSYEEAAYLSGYSLFGAFRKVVLPLVGPGLVATTLLAWVFSWNEFIFAFILSNTEVIPYTAVVPTLLEGNFTVWNRMMAMAIIATLPPTIILIWYRDHIIEGMSLGVTEV